MTPVATSDGGSAGEFVRALLSLLVTVGLVAGVPLALVLFVGWPLPSEVPSWEQLTGALVRQGITVEVLINALAVVVWLAWVPLTWAILVEAAAVARGRAARHVRAWPGAQLVARKLVASAALLVSSLAGMRSAHAAPLDPLVVVSAEVPAEEAFSGDLSSGWADARETVDVRGPAREDGEPGGAVSLVGAGDAVEPAGTWQAGTTVTASGPVEPASGRWVSGDGSGREAPPEVVHRVEHGETFWGLAEKYLGSGLRWREIRDHNVGRSVASGHVLAAGEDHLQAGWTIVVPGDGPAPSEPQGPASGGDPGSDMAGGSSVTVRSGEHFWALARRRLEEAWGRSATAEEIGPYWNRLVQENLDRLSSGTPDLVFPGERFTVPAPPPAPPGGRGPETSPPGGEAEAPVTEPPAEEPDAAEPEAPEPGGAEPGAPERDAAEPDAAEPGAPERDAADPDAPATPEGTAEAPDTSAAPSPAEEDELAELDSELSDDELDSGEEDDELWGLPVAVPFGASAVLAGLALVALARRRFSRRRRLRPAQIVEPRPAEDVHLERELALGAQDLVDTVAAASRAYGAALAANPDLPLVTGLLVSPAGDVIVRLAEPARPEVPFEPGPASDEWELYLDELDLDPELGPGPEPAAPVLDTPAVIGRTGEGGWVLVDLESAGALEVEGDAEVASDLIRSIVAELALQPRADRMVDISVVGVEGLSPEVLEQGVVSFDRLDEDLVRRVEQVAVEADALPARGAGGRARGLPSDGLFVTVVAVGGAATPDPVLLERLAAAATPGGRGIAVVAVAPLGPGATRVLVDESGDAHLPHMGVSVEAARLGVEDLERVERLLADEPEAYTSGEGEEAPFWPEWAWGAEDRSGGEGWMGAWLPYGAGEISSEEPPSSGPAGSVTPDDIEPPLRGLGEDVGVVPEEPWETGATGEPWIEASAVTDEGEIAGAGEARSGSGPRQPETPPAMPENLPPVSGDETAINGFHPYEPPAWELCVRIFADHTVVTVDGRRVSFRYGENPDVPNKNTHRGPELLAYLALSGRAATAEDIRDSLWWDRPVALGTVNKLVYGTRKVIGGADLLSHAQEDPLGRYRLAHTVVTDAQLLTDALEYAKQVANRQPEAAMEVLGTHLAGVEAVAFRSGHLGQGLMEWASAHRIIDAVELPVIEAALLMARLSCERGHSGYMDALWAIDQGLRACPFNEALVRVAMEIEALLGNTDAVNHRYLTLATKLARDELEPEPETSELRTRLGGTSRLRPASG